MQPVRGSKTIQSVQSVSMSELNAFFDVAIDNSDVHISVGASVGAGVVGAMLGAKVGCISRFPQK